VDTVKELQAKSNAANDVMAAVGQGMSTTVTVDDLKALGIAGVLPGNIAAIEAAIGTAIPANVATKSALQTLVNNAIGSNMDTALAILKTAAANNTASGPTALIDLDYAKAGITGVNSGNVSAINSALDSAVVGSAQLNTEALAQGVVDAYVSILASANGTPNTPATPLTGDVYTLVGVTGLQASGAPLAGSPLSLLDSVIDVKAATDVNTVNKLQILANEAIDVMIAAGQTTGAVALTGAELIALGVTGLTANNTQAVINAIVAQTTDANVDTLGKLQSVANQAETKANTALAAIITAETNNTASSQPLLVATYNDAGVTGLTTAGVTNNTLLGAVNSALDTGAVGTAHISSTANVQSIVNDYSAILGLADGTANVAVPAVTGSQYADIGITGITGLGNTTAPAAGSTVFLLDNAVDAKQAVDVDTVGELQAIANAAEHVWLAAAGGTQTLTATDLTALGIKGNFTIQSTLDAINTTVHATARIGVDQLSELQTIADNAAHPVLSSALNGVVNLDVRSNLVFTATSAVKLGTSGHIVIHETGGLGYGNDAVAGKAMVKIDATGTIITINPAWDLDLGATYSVSIDSGSFVSTNANNLTANAVSGLTFSTVTPGSHVAGDTVLFDSHASQKMDATGALVASQNWLNIGGLGDNTSSTPTLLGDLSTGSYALVLTNYATSIANPSKGFDGISAHDTNVSVTNFGQNDTLYFDSQSNNSKVQSYDGTQANLISANGHGGVAGQTAMELALTFSPQQNGSSAQIVMGFENNTTNQVFPTILDSGLDKGFASFLQSPDAVIMG
jgi:hypothetical protein